MKATRASILIVITLFLICSANRAAIIVSQSPATGGGVSRWSQLWQDPGPNGNDLDGDSVCWQGFTAGWPLDINHLEWWGEGASELGFQIEFWRQDPNTVAYQPIGVFYYGGDHTVLPEARFRVAPGEYSESADASGVTRFALDLVTPISLAANNATNMRWFVAIIGLTQKAYYTWNWAQGLGGTNGTFQFIRGGTSGGGPLFRSLGDGRAVLLSGVVHEPPRLRVAAVAPDLIEIAWPSEHIGYGLLKCSEVTSKTWTTVTNKAITTDTEFIVQLPISDAAQFFQLLK